MLIRNILHPLLAPSGRDWVHDQVSADHYADRKPRPQRQRRLQIEIATSDLLADLVGSVLQALARGDDHGAIGVVTARRAEFGADAGQGRKRGAGKGPERTTGREGKEGS